MCALIYQRAGVLCVCHQQHHHHHRRSSLSLSSTVLDKIFFVFVQTSSVHIQMVIVGRNLNICVFVLVGDAGAVREAQAQIHMCTQHKQVAATECLYRVVCPNKAFPFIQWAYLIIAWLMFQLHPYFVLYVYSFRQRIFAGFFYVSSHLCVQLCIFVANLVWLSHAYYNQINCFDVLPSYIMQRTRRCSQNILKEAIKYYNRNINFSIRCRVCTMLTGFLNFCKPSSVMIFVQLYMC